jgi:DHA1 family bicyclomycin/chloramphenicol resistance-like MFS transporter
MVEPCCSPQHNHYPNKETGAQQPDKNWFLIYIHHIVISFDTIMHNQSSGENIMLEKPLFKNLSSAASSFALLTLVIIMYIALCAEADIYVPAFPQMIQSFGVQENQIQLILSINFAGLCIAGLAAGPLSDSYGRRKILLSGLLLFVIGSAGCVCATEFNTMLFWRLIQGIAASVPMVIGCAVIVDKYPQEKTSQLIGVLNSVISAAMAGAPIAGAWISQAFNWRANFIVILGLALISFVGTLLFIEETLPSIKRKSFNILSICKDYAKITPIQQ